MYVRKQKIIVMVIIGLFSGALFASSDMDDPANPKLKSSKTLLNELAEIAIPLRKTLYTYEEISNIFEPILCPSTKESFHMYFSMIYKLPEPTKHSTEQVIGFLQCLYARLLMALESDNPAENDRLQLIELNKSLVPHKKYLEEVMSADSLNITGFACVECLNKAREKMGFEKVAEADYDTLYE